MYITQTHEQQATGRIEDEDGTPAKTTMMDEEDGEGGYISNTPTSRILAPTEVKQDDAQSILSINTQSLNKKMDRLRDLVHHVKPLVVCTQELWKLNPTTDYSIRGYQRPILTTRQSMGSDKSGGGVGFWIKNGTDYEEIKHSTSVGNYEAHTVKLPKLGIIVTNIYRPPGDQTTFFNYLEENLKKISEKTTKSEDMIITGDFNIDLTQQTRQSNNLLSSMLELDLTQRITTHTRVTDKTKTLIDHVYIKSKGNWQTDVITTDIADHLATLTTKTDNKVKKTKTQVTKRWFTPQAYEHIQTLLGAEDWSPMENMDTNDAANYLQSKIQEHSDTVAPILTKNMKVKKINQWTTKGIKISVKTCEKLYKAYIKKRKSNQIATLERQKHIKYKKILGKVTSKSKNMYYEAIIKDAGSDSRRVWGCLNEIVDRKQCKHKFPDTFRDKESNITDRKEIANLFNSYFANIGKQMADSQPDIKGFESYLSQTKGKFNLEKVNDETVSKIMKKQKPKLSCGLDGINNKLVKTCHEELAKPMRIIINKSIDTGIVPQAYKIGRIIPLYKKGNAGDCGNYRPVSLLSALSKILEKVICTQMMAYLNKQNLLCPDQFGFRPKSQTNHVIQKLMNHISQNATENKPTIATFLDLSKAFDCLQYDKLFKKLESLGFQNTTINWFKDYLHDREQIVDLEGTLSKTEKVNLGVPQGSILGPILFLLYINDVNKSETNAIFTKFADDTTVIATGKDIAEATKNMNDYMVNVDKWFSQNKLNLNPSKTRYMVFNTNKKDQDADKTELVKIRGEYLQRVWRKGKEKAFKLVGVWIDEQLKWGEHITAVKKKVNSAVYNLSQAGNNVSIKNKIMLYMGLVQSHLVFGSPFWGTAKKTRLQPLFIAQKRAIRKIYNLKYRDHTHEYFVKSNILKLQELIEYTILTYIHTSIDKFTPQNIVSLWRARQANQNMTLRDRGKQLATANTHKQWILDLPNNRQAKLWNCCPVDKWLEKNPFKSDLKRHYLKLYETNK